MLKLIATVSAVGKSLFTHLERNNTSGYVTTTEGAELFVVMRSLAYNTKFHISSRLPLHHGRMGATLLGCGMNSVSMSTSEYRFKSILLTFRIPLLWLLLASSRSFVANHVPVGAVTVKNYRAVSGSNS